MSIYSIRALSMENEFANLVYVGKYVDSLIERTGDLDYSVVWEWDERGPGDWPPVAVLARLNGKWWRRPVLVTSHQAKNGRLKFDLEFAD